MKLNKLKVFSERLISGIFVYSSMPKMRNGWKYTVCSEITVRTGIQPIEEYYEQYFSITAEGDITIKVGYSWDGASGPCPDHIAIMFGSCVHDAGCQLYHRGIYTKGNRTSIDDLLHEIVKTEMLARSKNWYQKLWANIWPGLVWVAVRGYTITK